MLYTYSGQAVDKVNRSSSFSAIAAYRGNGCVFEWGCALTRAQGLRPWTYCSLKIGCSILSSRFANPKNVFRQAQGRLPLEACPERAVCIPILKRLIKRTKVDFSTALGFYPNCWQRAFLPISFDKSPGRSFSSFRSLSRNSSADDCR